MAPARLTRLDLAAPSPGAPKLGQGQPIEMRGLARPIEVMGLAKRSEGLAKAKLVWPRR